MTVCPKCGYEFESDNGPSASFDEPLPDEEGLEASADAGLYLLRKEKKRKRMLVGGIAAGAFLVCLTVVFAFWMMGDGEKPGKVTQKREAKNIHDQDKADISNALQAVLKIQAIALPDVAFSEYNKQVNNALIELNALPTELPMAEGLRNAARYYQAAKDIWIGTILMDTTPLESLEESVASSLRLLNLVDPATGTCKRDLDKNNAALCSSLAAFHLWKQKGTYAAREDKGRIRERLDPIRLELWKKASEDLESYKRQ
jgi:hypothetical protein